MAANRLCGRICHSMPHSVAAEIVRQRGVSVCAQQPCMMSSSSANTAGCVNGGSGSVSALA